MTALLVELLPLAIAAAAVPAYVALMILLLQGKHGRAGAFAFVAGVLVMRLTHGALFGLLYRLEAEAIKQATALIQSVLMLVLAIVLLVAGIGLWLKGDDPEAAPRKWMLSVAQTSPARSFFYGVAVMTISTKHWLLSLTAVQTIGYAALPLESAAALFLLFALGASLPLWIPLLLAVVAPVRSTAILQRWRNWIDANYHAVTIVVSLAFGIIFLWMGLGGLVG